MVTINNIQYEVVAEDKMDRHPHVRALMDKRGIATQCYLRKPRGKKLFMAVKYESGNYSITKGQ